MASEVMKDRAAKPRFCTGRMGRQPPVLPMVMDACWESVKRVNMRNEEGRGGMRAPALDGDNTLERRSSCTKRNHFRLNLAISGRKGLAISVATRKQLHKPTIEYHHIG